MVAHDSEDSVGDLRACRGGMGGSAGNDRLLLLDGSFRLVDNTSNR